MHLEPYCDDLSFANRNELSSGLFWLLNIDSGEAVGIYMLAC